MNAPVVVTMGDAAGTQLIYRIRNANTNPDTGDSITKVEFNLNAPYTWSNTTAAPAGWQRTTLSATQIIFTAVSPTKIATGSSQDFTLILGTIPSGAQDSTDLLRSVKSTYDDAKSDIMNNPASSAWKRKSLQVNSFTAVDSVTGLQASSPGRQLTVTLVVTNRSTLNWTGIVSVPQPPNTVIAWTSGSTTITTGSSPSLNLISGQTGTLTWTYTIGSNCGVVTPPVGSAYFSITNLKDSSNAVTSKPVTSNTVAIGCFTGVIALSSTSISSGTNVTVTMTLRNGFAQSITAVGAMLATGGTATSTFVSGSGPNYSSTTIAAGATITATWVYTITGSAAQTYFFTGSVSGTLQTVPTKAVNAVVNASAVGSIISPLTITATTSATADRYKTVSVGWDFTNTQPNPVKTVEITFPAGWVFGDGSCLINNAGTEVDDWTVGVAGSIVTFTAGTNMIPGDTGKFIIIFSDIPAVQSGYIFPVKVTESAPGNPSTTINTTVNVGAAGAGITSPGLWKEIIQ